MRIHRKTKRFKPGQWIYGIEIVDNDFKNAKISGFIYMGECNNYIICCSQYSDCGEDFAKQMKLMYKESVREKSVCLNLLHKKYAFAKREDAYRKLCALQMKFCRLMENIKNESGV